MRQVQALLMVETSSDGERGPWVEYDGGRMLDPSAETVSGLTRKGTTFRRDMQPETQRADQKINV